MKKIKVELLPIKDGDSVQGVVIRERKKGDNWNREEVYNVVSGTPGASREILLDDDERLVVEGEQTHRLVLDRDQMMATFEPADPKEAAQKRDSDARIREENIRREEAERNMTDEQRRHVGPRTTLGRPIPTPAPATPSVQPGLGTEQKPRIVEDDRPMVDPRPKIEPTKVPVPPQVQPQAQPRPSAPGGAADSKEVKK